MKNKYNANNLFVGRLMYTSSDFNKPLGFQTDLKYIFEAKSIKDKFFKDIFGGRVAESEYSSYKDGHFYKRFDKLYIIDIKCYTDYFPQDYGDALSLDDLEQRLNQINGLEEQSKFGI